MRAGRGLVALALAALPVAPGVGAGAPAQAPPTMVRFGEYFYRPAIAAVRVGERVRFVNVGRIDHTVADVDARGRVRGTVIRPRLLSRGQAQIVTFRAAGVVRYVCTLHPTRMRGVVRVTR